MGIIAYVFGGIGLFLLLDGALLHTGIAAAADKPVCAVMAKEWLLRTVQPRGAERPELPRAGEHELHKAGHDPVAQL